MHRKAVILLSRQPLRPNGRTAWIQRTVEAVQWVRNQNLSLVTSIGMQTWEFLTALAAEFYLKQEVLIPVIDEQSFHQDIEWTKEQFSLKVDRTSFMPVFPLDNDKPRDLPVRRDRAAVEIADVVIPVSIKPRGNMERLVEEALTSGKEINSTFAATYKPRADRLKYEIDRHNLNPEIDTIGNRYLIHWTRSSNGVWPDERQIKYWRAVLNSKEYPRGALYTLQHILSTKTIIGSTRHMPGKIASVSFSGLVLREALTLMRWRTRYHEMSFEPYGIGLERGYALTNGVAKVKYVDSLSQPEQQTPDFWCYQSQGRKADWRSEEEYRFRGNFDLGSVPSSKMIVFCYRSDEAAFLESTTGIKTISILNE